MERASRLYTRRQGFISVGSTTNLRDFVSFRLWSINGPHRAERSSSQRENCASAINPRGCSNLYLHARVATFDWPWRRRLKVACQPLDWILSWTQWTVHRTIQRNRTRTSALWEVAKGKNEKGIPAGLLRSIVQNRAKIRLTLDWFSVSLTRESARNGASINLRQVRERFVYLFVHYWCFVVCTTACLLIIVLSIIRGQNAFQYLSFSGTTVYTGETEESKK